MKHTLILMTLLATMIIAKGQNTERPNYKLDMQGQLTKFGQDMTSFPQNDYCGRLGNGTLLQHTKDTTLQSFQMEKGFIKGDTSTPTGLGKFDGDRNVFWIHGLNGNHETWFVPAVGSEKGYPDIGFPARKLKSIRPGEVGTKSYTEDFGLKSAAQDLSGKVDNMNLNRTEFDFAIAHSQGGLILREWLRLSEIYPSNYLKDIHGIVTFGTPHGGARILNLTRSDMENHVTPFFKEACHSLTSAFVESYVKPKVYSSWIAQMIISDEKLKSTAEMLCNKTVDAIVPFSLGDFHQNTTRDYYVGAPYLESSLPNVEGLKGLNKYPISTSVVQFYGEEEEPVMWRYVSSMLHKGESEMTNSNLRFGYTNDNQLIDSVMGIINNLQVEYNKAEFEYTINKNRKCVKVAPPMLDTYRMCEFERKSIILEMSRRMESYEKAIVWFKNVNDYYKIDLIGAEIVQNDDLTCIEFERKSCSKLGTNTIISKSFKESISKISNPNQCPSGSVLRTTFEKSNGEDLICLTVNGHNLIHNVSFNSKPNDGVVLTESSKYILPVANLSTSTYRQVTLPKTNHSQMLNCKITKDALTELYNGNYGGFFKTEKR